MASVDWWVVSPGGNQSNGANSQVIQTAQGSAEDNALLSGGTVKVGSSNLARYLGPYQTQQQAKTAKPDSSLQFAGSLIGLGATSAIAGATANPALGSVAPAVGAATGTAAGAIGSTIGSVANFLQGLTTANLWIRVAKIIAGGAILLIGLAKITHLDQKVGSVASKAVKVAPFL